MKISFCKIAIRFLYTRLHNLMIKSFLAGSSKVKSKQGGAFTWDLGIGKVSTLMGDFRINFSKQGIAPQNLL